MYFLKVIAKAPNPNSILGAYCTAKPSQSIQYPMSPSETLIQLSLEIDSEETVSGVSNYESGSDCSFQSDDPKAISRDRLYSESVDIEHGEQLFILKRFSGNEEQLKKMMALKYLADSMDVSSLFPPVTRIQYDDKTHRLTETCDDDELQRLYDLSAYPSNIILFQARSQCFYQTKDFPDFDSDNFQKLSVLMTVFGWDDGSIFNIGLMDETLVVIDSKNILPGGNISSDPQFVYDPIEGDMFFRSLSVLDYLPQAHDAISDGVKNWFLAKEHQVAMRSFIKKYDSSFLKLFKKVVNKMEKTDHISISNLCDNVMPFKMQLVDAISKYLYGGDDLSPDTIFGELNPGIKYIFKRLIQVGNMPLEEYKKLLREFIFQLRVNDTLKNKLRELVSKYGAAYNIESISEGVFKRLAKEFS